MELVGWCGERWIFEAALIGTYNAAPDMVVQCNAPAGTTGRFSAASIESAVAANAAYNASTVSLALTTGADEIRITGGLITTAAGTVNVQVRNNAGVIAQTLFAGSWIKAERVA